MATLAHWVWLSIAMCENPQKCQAILSLYPDPQQFYEEGPSSFQQVPGLGRKEIGLLEKATLAKAEEAIKICESLGADIIPFDDARYPQRLKDIPDPPCVLYCKGDLGDIDNSLAIGMVGARICSEYGLRSAARLSYDLARLGAIIVSGMARGVDTASHRGALKAGGKTISVLGCGIDRVYPPENKQLKDIIEESGAVLTEFPPRSEPLGFHFPIRNRIISGLSCGVLVVEATKRSGSLITARLAGEQGKDVFAVPGNIDQPFSEGANDLLRDGAYIATNALDVVDKYRHLFADQIKEEVPAAPEFVAIPVKEAVEESFVKPPVPDYKEEEKRKLNAALGLDPLNIDEIAVKTGLHVSVAVRFLTQMEMDGTVLALPGRRYRLVNK